MSSRDPTVTVDGELPEEKDGARLVGVAGYGAPVYYHKEDHMKYEAHEDAHLESPTEWAVTENLSPDHSLSDLIDEIEEDVGWDSLTEWAESHRDSGDDDESED